MEPHPWKTNKKPLRVSLLIKSGKSALGADLYICGDKAVAELRLLLFLLLISGAWSVNKNYIQTHNVYPQKAGGCPPEYKGIIVSTYSACSAPRVKCCCISIRALIIIFIHGDRRRVHFAHCRNCTKHHVFGGKLNKYKHKESMIRLF
jgi:hypothetical protein